MTATFNFEVGVPFDIHNDESVFVAHDQGNWEIENAFELEEKENGVWVGSMSLDAVVLKFRYFIAYRLQSEEAGLPVLVISKWETNLQPRWMVAEEAMLLDTFGDGGVGDGWALADGVNQLLLTVSGEALKFIKTDYNEKKYRLKMVATDLRRGRNGSDDEESTTAVIDQQTPLVRVWPSHSSTEIATFAFDAPKFRDQSEFGEHFDNVEDYFIFRTNSVAIDFLNFCIELYSEKDKLVARCNIMPSTLHDTFGLKLWAPLLTRKGKAVGKIYFSYLCIRPVLNLDMTMDNCYANHWKQRPTVKVGHRGLGESYTKRAAARENTLNSLLVAAKNGADWVEFDLLLTRERMAVLFHDFHVKVSVAKRLPSGELNYQTSSSESDDGEKLHRSQMDFYTLAVKDLELKQLNMLNLEHVGVTEHGMTDDNNRRITGAQDEPKEHRAFPTLSMAFKALPESIGFDIEVKYPQLMADNTTECSGYFSRDEVVDNILCNVFANAGHRRIIFSSFDPSSCIMLSLKQKKYPVMFLSLGESKRYVQYADERTRTSIAGVKFAKVFEFLGVVFNSETLDDPLPLRMAKDLGQVRFVWGDNLTEPEMVDRYKNELSVEGLIYDRIGEGELGATAVFTLAKEKESELFAQNKSSAADEAQQKI